MSQQENKQRTANITYMQAGVLCFVGQESAKFKVQFFVGSSVVKTSARRKPQTISGNFETQKRL